MVEDKTEEQDGSISYPCKISSWLINSSWEAVKTVDITTINAKKTPIPKAFSPFFFDRSIVDQDSGCIIACVDGESFQLKLSKKPSSVTPFLLLHPVSDILKLKNLIPDVDKIFFDFDEEQKCFIISTLTSDPSLSIKPSIQYQRPSETSKSGQVQQRRGQNYFREAVKWVCNNSCVVTEVKEIEPSILIASHIKPWVEANDDEKLDGHNGLLLAPHIDKLFDSHLISFDKEGVMLVNPKAEEALNSWRVCREKKHTFSDKNHVYLEHHREKFQSLLRSN
ncbi:HNH endonuclease [Vibrio profundum]|uniref:HNH endonuclease n=1 Tax=Vibrio profundum TaxID=2910247 RepID=UPI003D0EAEE4